MSDPARKRMTSDEFIAWAMQQDARYELVAGGIVAMAPERSAHARTRFHIARRLADAIATRIVRDAPILLDPPGIVLTDGFPPGTGGLPRLHRLG